MRTYLILIGLLAATPAFALHDTAEVIAWLTASMFLTPSVERKSSSAFKPFVA